MIWSSAFGGQPNDFLRSWQEVHARVEQALLRQDALDPDLLLIHLGLVCNISTATATATATGDGFYVVEIRQLVRGGPSPRGFNQTILLNRNLDIIERIEIASARPLYCDGDEIIFDRAVEVTKLNVDGNLIQIDKAGRIKHVRYLVLGKLRGLNLKGVNQR
jgi:hypothetical protein